MPALAVSPTSRVLRALDGEWRVTRDVAERAGVDVGDARRVLDAQREGGRVLYRARSRTTHRRSAEWRLP